MLPDGGLAVGLHRASQQAMPREIIEVAVLADDDEPHRRQVGFRTSLLPDYQVAITSGIPEVVHLHPAILPQRNVPSGEAQAGDKKGMVLRRSAPSPDPAEI